MASPPPGGEDAKFQRWLEAMAAEQLAEESAVGGAAAGGGSGPGRPRHHDNEWYADRCVFCAACRTAVDAEPGRRGARCAGCRRWFHYQCHQAHGGGGGSGPAQFFHSAECERGYGALLKEAARGRRPLPAAGRSGGLLEGLFGALRGGAGRGAPAGAPGEQPLSVRLMDLSDVKQQYKSLQSSGALPARRQRALEAAGLVAPRLARPPGSEAVGGSEEAAGGAGQGTGGWKGSALDDFILASELMTRQWPGDRPKDILEDGFGVLLSRGASPLCAATLNLHAPDHARIQVLVSAGDQRRRGHASALLGELHRMLGEAGLSRVVAIVAEDTEEARAARDRLLKRRFGYRDLPIEDLVALRRELPEYHKQLVGGATLLVRQLEAPQQPGQPQQPRQQQQQQQQHQQPEQQPHEDEKGQGR